MLVNTATASFNTIMGQMTKTCQQKIPCVKLHEIDFLLKKLAISFECVISVETYYLQTPNFGIRWATAHC